jgi:preprotein translocase subunit SecG
MLAIFGILIIIASVVLGLIVLVQNPKGGGLAGSLSGFGNQLMGVKQSTDILEKGTWLFAAIVGILCLISPLFIDKQGSSSKASDELLQGVRPAAPATPKPNTGVPAVLDTTKP